MEPTSSTFMLCNCSESSSNVSLGHIGMLPVKLPLSLKPPLMGHKHQVVHLQGHWYWHPYTARCTPSQQLGHAGCSWQRAPLSHSVTLAQLLKLGLNCSVDASGPAKLYHQPLEKTLHNIQVFKHAWDVLGLPRCVGESNVARTAGQYGWQHY